MAKDKSEDKESKTNIQEDWAIESPTDGKIGTLFKPEELDIYVNKVTLEAYIFHGKDIDYDSLDHLEYNPVDYSVDVVKKDGNVLDLGVKIQWLVRPYFVEAHEISIVQTKDGESIGGTVIPLINKDKKG